MCVCVLHLPRESLSHNRNIGNIQNTTHLPTVVRYSKQEIVSHIKCVSRLWDINRGDHERGSSVVPWVDLHEEEETGTGLLILFHHEAPSAMAEHIRKALSRC